MPVRFLNPNYHVILIHYPLGVFVLGVILELFSFLWRKSTVRAAARWMILLGALLSLPAATSGIAALADVQKQGTWGLERYGFMHRHVMLMSIGTLLACFFALVGLGANDRWRERWTLRIPVLLGLIAAWGFMTWGAWYGGETIYTQGTSVALVKYKGKEEPKTILVKIPAQEAVDESSLTPEQRSAMKYQRYARFLVGGEKQVHIVFAGVALAVALGALGLSIRRLTTLRSQDAERVEIEQQETTLIGGPPRRVTDDVTVVRTLNPDATVDPIVGRVPVSRFWILAALLTAITGVLGYWILEKDLFFTAEGWHKFLHVIPYAKESIRHFTHFALTIALVAVMFIMAALAFWAPRRPLLLTIFSTLLVLLLAAQVWVGVLLTFDEEGPLTHFNKTESAEGSDDSTMNTTPSHIANSPMASAVVR